jgi:hypothetical protein
MRLFDPDPRLHFLQQLRSLANPVVGRDGKASARFSPDTLPDSPELTADIEQELAK